MSSRSGRGRAREEARAEGCEPAEAASVQRPPAEMLYADELAPLRGRRRRPEAAGLGPVAARGAHVHPRRPARGDSPQSSWAIRRSSIARWWRSRPTAGSCSWASRAPRSRCSRSCSRRRSRHARRSRSRAARARPTIRSSTRGTTRCCSPRVPRRARSCRRPLYAGMREGRRRALRGDHALPARDPGLAPRGALRPRAGGPRAEGRGRDAVRQRRLQRHRHGEHPRPRRQRDERRAQAPLQLRDRVPHRATSRSRWSWCATRRGACSRECGVPDACRARTCSSCWSRRSASCAPGETTDGQADGALSTAMSTAEAVSVAHAVGVRGYFLGGAPATPGDLVECLVGAAVKGDPRTSRACAATSSSASRSAQGAHWKAYYEARHRSGCDGGAVA